ncbi:MAG: hypothetical protein JWL59_3683 [Chthoniobacteraceae bacterium]|nr:hypothetical protein [Chthoniobacteraceae bacterium]
MVQRWILLLSLFVLSMRALAAVPEITALDPAKAPFGSKILLRGHGFTGTEQVTFVQFPGRVYLPASFREISDSVIEVVVPSPNPSSGKMAVMIKAAGGVTITIAPETQRLNGTTSVGNGGQLFVAKAGANIVFWGSGSCICLMEAGSSFSGTAGGGNLYLVAAGATLGPTALTSGGNTAYVAEGAIFNGPNGTAVPAVIGSYIPALFEEDLVTSPLTLTDPVANHAYLDPIPVSFSLPEAALAGSLKLTFNDGIATRVLTLGSSEEVAGTHSFSFQSANPTSSPMIASGPAIPNGLYTVELSYQDVFGHPAVSAQRFNVRIATSAPVLTLGTGSLAYSENSPALAIAPAGSAADAAWNEGRLEVSISANVSSQDSLSIKTGDGLSVIANSLFDEGILFGSLNTNGGVLTGPGTLTVTFNGNANDSRVQKLIRAIAFGNSSNDPIPGERIVTFTLINQVGLSTTALRIVKLAAVNDAPALSSPGGIISFIEGNNFVSNPVLVSSGILVSDPDNSTLASGTVAIGTNYLSSEDLLGFTYNQATMGNIDGSFDSGTGVLTLSSPGATATTSQWQAALRTVTYTNLSESPGTSIRAISFTVSDNQTSGLSVTQILNVVSINDTPLSAGQSLTTDEDTAKAITLAGSDVDSSYLNYQIVAQPQHGFLSGTAPNLNYIPELNYRGSDSFSFKVGDGSTFSNPATVTISVEDINDEPTLSALPDVQISENADTRIIPLSGISTGASNESQTLKVTAVSSNPSLFADLSVTYTSAEPNGLLSFKPAPNANGTTTITVTVDDGAASNHTLSRTFSVSVAPINNAPSFLFGADLFVARDAGAQIFPEWAGDITPGPANEASQGVQFIVTANQPDLFSAQPTISPDGTLRFTPAADGSGTATVQVVIIDNGGTANGGVDTSSPKTFHIAITSNAEESGIYAGLLRADPSVAPANKRAGVIRLAVKRGGLFSGVVRIAGNAFPLRGYFDQGGTAHFRKGAGTELVLTKIPRLALTLQLDVAGNTGQLLGIVTEESAPFAVVEADRALYTADKNASPPYLRLPDALAGPYTVRFSVNESALDPARLPHGYGIAAVNVRSDGSVRLAGTLADGTPISCASALSKNNRWPLYAAFARGDGSISGYVQFQDVPAADDLDGRNLYWFSPEQPGAKRYPLGWADGLKTELIGSKFVMPASARSNENASFPLPDSTAELMLAGGGLPESGLSKAISISRRNVGSVITPGAERLKINFNRNGYFSGSFLYPETQLATKFRGVILQKQEVGSGFFLGPTQSGAVTIEATQ